MLTEGSAKPATFNGDLTNLPAALRSRTQEKRWVVWRWTWRSEQQRWDKPPLQAADPTLYAKSNDPTTWGTYQDAVAAVMAGHADGIGYMLAGSDLNAADLDDCYTADTGEIAAWAQTEIASANSYVEVTPSGTGLRILGVGKGAELHRKFSIPGTTNGAAIEVYRATNRYITITGLQLGTTTTLTDIASALDSIVARYESNTKSAPGSKIGADTDIISSTADIEALIKFGARRGIRSEMFSRVVWSLAAKGQSEKQIIQKLAAHPNGIASKYEGRLEREVGRCFKKNGRQKTLSRPLRTKNRSGPTLPSIKMESRGSKKPTATRASQFRNSGSSVHTTNFTTACWSAAMRSINGPASYLTQSTSCCGK
jgi:hypothetical protein